MKDNCDEPLSQEEYIQERNLLYGHQQNQYDKYEKAILTLGTALFAFSVAYLRLLPVDVVVQAKWLLIASWIGFGVSIVAVLLSFLMNARGFDEEIRAAEKAMCDASVLRERNPWGLPVRLLYGLAGFAIATGVISLICFSIVNLSSL